MLCVVVVLCVVYYGIPTAQSACCVLKQHEADAGKLLVRQVGGQAKQKNRQVVKTGETDRWLYCKDKRRWLYCKTGTDKQG